MVTPTISYDGKSVVSIYYNVPDGVDFDDALAVCESIRAKYRRTKPGSDWGCDGIGYVIQKGKRQIVLHRSGVGSRSYKGTK